MQKKFWKGHCQQDRQGMMSAINCLLEPSAWSLSDTSTAQTEATVTDPGFVLCDFSLCSFCSPKALVFLLHTACCPPTCRHRQAQMPKQCFLHVNSLKKKKADLLDYMHLTVLPLKEVFFWTLFKNSDFFFSPTWIPMAKSVHFTYLHIPHPGTAPGKQKIPNKWVWEKLVGFGELWSWRLLALQLGDCSHCLYGSPNDLKELC